MIDIAMNVLCPTCRAWPGQPCRGTGRWANRPMDGFHASRTSEARLGIYDNNSQLDHDTLALFVGVLGTLGERGVDKDAAIAAIRRVARSQLGNI